MIMRRPVNHDTFNRFASYAFWALLAVIIALAIFAPGVLTGDDGSLHEIQSDAR
jgi:hypothetical protein